jgi:formate/nitrite transporter FocA (FNT family)
MPNAPTPEEIYDDAEREGARRLSMPLLEQASTGFIAGVTIVLGIVALGVTQALAEPALGPEMAQILGALAFGIGLVFLVVGRSELFTENFFDPVAAALDRGERSTWRQLLRLWAVILMLNLIGGAVLVAITAVEGALPPASHEVLVNVAEEIAGKSAAATLARAVLAGALLTLLSYLLHGVVSTTGRVLIAFMVGFFVAVGPFDHVVVSALHLLYGVWLSDGVTHSDIARNIALSTVGNLAGGLVLVTLTHTAQVKGGRSRTV